MANAGKYPQAGFKDSQQFLAQDPSRSQLVRVTGSSILDATLENLKSNGNIVQTVDTLTEAIATDYSSGIFVLTGGELSVLDGGQAIYRVSDPGSGGITMDNGNELILLIQANAGDAGNYNVGSASDEIPTNAIANTLRVATVTDIAQLPAATIGRKVNVTGYHAGTTVGGGGFVGKVGRHNGGTVIDPSRSAEFGTAAYYVDSGSDANCWVRTGNDTRINVEWFGAAHDFIPDNTGLSGTDDSAAVQAAYNTGQPIYVPAGKYRIANELNFDIDGTAMFGAGWFRTLFYYTQTEGAGICLKIREENQTISDIGFINGINIGAPNNRVNTGIDQTVEHANLGMQNVYFSGFGYCFRGGNYFANRVVVEFAKQVAWHDEHGRKSTLMNVTFADNRVHLLIGDGTNNTQCQDKGYSNIHMENNTNAQWDIDQPPAMKIDGKAAHLQFTNIRIVKPHGSAIVIDNEYSNGGSPTLGESDLQFTNVRIRNNRGLTSSLDCIDIANSTDVSFTQLNTHQPGAVSWDNAINIADTNTFVRLSNSSIGGTGLSIGGDSIGGQIQQVAISNSQINKNSIVYDAVYSREDSPRQNEGNVTGSKNLTIGSAKTIEMTLTGGTNISSIVNGQSDGDRLRFIFKQDSTGGHQLSFTGSKWLTDTGSTGAANEILTVEFEYDQAMSKFVQIGSGSGWL